MFKRIAPAQWLCLTLAVLLSVLAIVVFYTDTLPVEATETLIAAHKTGVGMLTPDAPITQTFRAGDNHLYAVDVMVSNYNKKVHEGSLSVWITDASGCEVARLDRPVEGLRNNAFITVPFASPAKDSRGQVYTLHATSDCVEQKGVTLRMGPVEPQDDLLLTLADGTADAENALNLRLCYTHSRRSAMGFTTLLIIAVCFAAGIPLGKRKEYSHD